jgi:hypothetical protein
MEANTTNPYKLAPSKLGSVGDLVGTPQWRLNNYGWQGHDGRGGELLFCESGIK